MRLGGPIHEKCASPDDWAAAVRDRGYRAAFAPIGLDADDDTVAAWAAAAANADIVIAEVGAWSNPISADDQERTGAMAKCKACLGLAERIGARCCVNITGSRGPKWDGPFAEDLTDDTFDMIVQCVREIVDEVSPTRTFYTLETMPWMYPDSADSYLRLLEAIDRPRVAVHFDPVNLINCPARFFDTAAVIDEFVDKLGDRIQSCHCKDIRLGEKLTVHLDEVPPGQGGLDYATFLRRIGRLDANMPLMLEHMKPEQYAGAADYIRGVAAEIGEQV